MAYNRAKVIGIDVELCPHAEKCYDVKHTLETYDINMP